ncbi:MAG: cytochrome c3 family protein [Elusimicrobia bacterium]|nr:cytochrome c3 family protein [Elusimicrobiota bacterium]
MTPPADYHKNDGQRGQKSAYGPPNGQWAGGGGKRFYGPVLVLYGAAIIVLLLGAAFYAYSRLAPAGSQPIAYNHKKHLALGLECSSCHLGIADGRAHARLPSVEVCAACHSSEDENPRTKVIRDYVSGNKPIPWKKIYGVPDHVYFSHRRHAGLGKLDCALCHGDMSKAEAPVTKQAEKITMARCIDCHHKLKVTTDCIACHR